MNRKNIKKLAFTMFEAVIVMIVIGMIAMFLTNVIRPNDARNKALITKAERNLAIIDEATQQIIINNSKDGTLINLANDTGTDFSLTTALNATNTVAQNELTLLYKKYLKTSRQQPKTTSTTQKGFLLANGCYVEILITNKVFDTLILPEEKQCIKSSSPFGTILIDVNDDKAPNSFGIDKFQIQLGERGLIYNPVAS